MTLTHLALGLSGTVISTLLAIASCMHALKKVEGIIE